MNNNDPPHRSHLFTVRLWKEQLGDGESEYRGRVKHVLSGETHHFRKWSALVALLEAKVVELDRQIGKEQNDAKRSRD